MSKLYYVKSWAPYLTNCERFFTVKEEIESDCIIHPIEIGETSLDEILKAYNELSDYYKPTYRPFVDGKPLDMVKETVKAFAVKANIYHIVKNGSGHIPLYNKKTFIIDCERREILDAFSVRIYDCIIGDLHLMQKYEIRFEEIGRKPCRPNYGADMWQ